MLPNKANPFGIGQIVTARARKAVRELLDHFVDSDDPLADASEPLRQLGEMYESMAPAFAEALLLDNPQKRILAAYFVIRIRETGLAHISDEAANAANAVMVEALRRDDDQLRTVACKSLSSCKAIDDVLPYLRKLIKSSDKWLSLWSASALANSDEPRDIIAAQDILWRSLHGDDEDMAAIAGCRLLSAGLALEEARAQLMRILPKLKARNQFLILSTFKHIGVHKSFFDLLANILSDRTKDPEVRRLAAILLGNIPERKKEAVVILTKMLTSTKWPVVWGAAEGLKQSGEYPKEARETLIDLLSHDSADLREISALCLSGLGQFDAILIETLGEKLRTEPETKVCIAVGNALAAAGKDAVPVLVDIIKEGNATRGEIAVRALRLIDRDAAITLAELLPTADENVAAVLMWSFVWMGDQLAPAIPVLARVLNETLDDEIALCAAMAISFSGDAAKEAVDALIDCIIQRSGQADEVRRWAEAALWQIREISAPILRSLIKNAEGQVKNRLEHVLSRLATSSSVPRDSLYYLMSDPQIDEFMQIAQLFVSGGAMGWRAVQRLLRQDALKYKNVPAPNTLQKRMKLLGERWNRELFKTDDREKSMITDEGKEIFLKINKLRKLMAQGQE